MPQWLRELLRRIGARPTENADQALRSPSTAEQRERLARLEELRDQGLLTESELAEQRRRILGE